MTTKTETLTLPVSQDYAYVVTVTDVPATGTKHLRIAAQWLGAKDPQALQSRFAITLPADQLKTLAQHLLENAA